MIVSDVTEFTKKQSKVFIDGSFAFVLYKGELHLYGIAKDKTISCEDYDKILHEVLPKRCKLRSMNLLMTKSYTEMKMREKLLQGLYPSNIIDVTIAYLKSYGYINDDLYASDFLFYKGKKYSKRQLIQKMKQKGLSDDVIHRAFVQYEEQEGGCDEQALICKFLAKKHYMGWSKTSLEDNSKLLKSIMQKGFSYDDVKKMMMTYNN